MLSELEITEMLTEQSLSEIDNIKKSIITFIIYKFGIFEKESNGNCIFKALSSGWLIHQHISVMWGRKYEITFYIIHRNSKFIYLMNLISILKLFLRMENGMVRRNCGFSWLFKTLCCCNDKFNYLSKKKLVMIYSLVQYLNIFRNEKTTKSF